MKLPPFREGTCYNDTKTTEIFLCRECTNLGIDHIVCGEFDEALGNKQKHLNELENAA